MVHPSQDQGEEPLDPAMVALAGRIRRFGMVSIGILFLGIFAVFGAVLYKATSRGSSIADLEEGAVLTLVAEAAPGQAIHEMVASDGVLTVALQAGEAAPARLIFIDLARLRIVASMVIGPQAGN
ncbi:MAG: hypothetical protein KDI98_07445 [Hyphomicrobiaceae bacterium]|nr:hypothetical protein [Hyphomicrobiaceae bacterium]